MGSAQLAFGAQSGIVINEIHYHPDVKTDPVEFIELFNSNPYVEDISGFRLSGDIDFTFASNTVLAARAYLVVASVPTDMQSV